MKGIYDFHAVQTPAALLEECKSAQMKTPAGLEVLLLTFYFLASIADRSPALKTNAHCPQKCLETVLFVLSCPESSSHLIDCSVDLYGHDAQVGHFCGPGLVGGQKAMEMLLEAIVDYGWLIFTFVSTHRPSSSL